MKAASYAERLVTFLARDLRDGEVVLAGANSLLPRMAFRLARLTHAPGLVVWSAFSYARGGNDIGRVGDSATDYLAAAPSGMHPPPEVTLGDVGRIGDVFYVGGLQVDRFGGTNLWGLKGRDGRLAVAGPGPVGTTTMGAFVRRTVVIMTRHSPKTFVAQCDYTTCLGHRAPDGRTRSELGLPGGGPRWVCSPLGVFGFDPGGTMRPHLLRPGVTAEDVRRSTGFPMEWDAAGEIPAPTAEDLEYLRSGIDENGYLQEEIMPLWQEERS
jgi:glutaconate CoA-transferase, subunit B